MQRKPQLQPYRVDLRVGVLPPDAAALGETEWSKAHRVGQTSLCLKPHGGLRLPLPETTVPSAGVADFTITLDVMIDRTDWPAGAVEPSGHARSAARQSPRDLLATADGGMLLAVATGMRWSACTTCCALM